MGRALPCRTIAAQRRYGSGLRVVACRPLRRPEVPSALRRVNMPRRISLTFEKWSATPAAQGDGLLGTPGPHFPKRRLLMAAIIFTCPVTHLKVQHWLDDS